LNKRIVERTQKREKPEVPIDHINKSYDEYKESLYKGGVSFDSGKVSIREMADKILVDLKLI